MRTLRRLVGTAGGLGFLPLAPGTWTSLAVVLAVAWVDLGPLPVGGIAALFLLVGLWAGGQTVADFGEADPGAFVLDEVVGQLIALLPLFPGPMRPLDVAVAFLAFRLFDVLKPPPCGRLERLPGALGIMADDVAAGMYAMALVLVVA